MEDHFDCLRYAKIATDALLRKKLVDKHSVTSSELLQKTTQELIITFNEDELSAEYSEMFKFLTEAFIIAHEKT
jgi:hypothetical protein